MAYCDYAFYTTEYYGNVIPEVDFMRLAERASDKLNQFTFDRLVYGMPDDERTAIKVKKATCKVAEILYDIEAAEKANRESTGYEKGEDGLLKGKTISSISAGSESISYASNSSSMINAVLTDKVASERIIFEAVREYLGNTGLLYAGI